MIDTTLVYLDTSFIVEAYEFINKTPVPVTITKTIDKSAGLTAWIANAGVSAQETREFPVSSRRMYEDIKVELDTIPSVSMKGVDYNSLPNIFWAEGTFAVGSSKTTRSGEVIDTDQYFRLYDREEQKRGVYLFAKPVYFSSGYEQILEHIHGAARGFGIKARVLVKTLALQPDNFWPLCVALVIIKTGNE